MAGPSLNCDGAQCTAESPGQPVQFLEDPRATACVLYWSGRRVSGSVLVAVAAHASVHASRRGRTDRLDAVRRGAGGPRLRPCDRVAAAGDARVARGLRDLGI